MEKLIDKALIGNWVSNHDDDGNRWGLKFFSGGTCIIYNEIRHVYNPFKSVTYPEPVLYSNDCLWSAENGFLKINAASISLQHEYKISDSELHLSGHKEPLQKASATTPRSEDEENKIRENVTALCIAKALMLLSTHVECRLREVDKKLAYQGQVIFHSGDNVKPAQIAFDHVPDSEMFKSYMAYVLNDFLAGDILPEYDDILREKVCDAMLNGIWELYFSYCDDGFMQSILIVYTTTFGEVSFPFDISEPDMAKFVADVRARQV